MALRVKEFIIAGRIEGVWIQVFCGRMSEICLRIKLFIFLIIMLICYDILPLCCPRQVAFFINQKIQGWIQTFLSGVRSKPNSKIF